MNQCIIDLFKNHRINRLVQGLPKAFEMATQEIPKGNPAVGIIREHILTGFFINEFGKNKVIIQDDGIKRGTDINVCGHDLSIKTVSGNGEIKALWTVDPLRIGMEISRDYKPICDIFLVNIFWGKEKESVFYIPQSVQVNTRNELGDKYLKANVGTNHRGISISKLAMENMKKDNNVLKKSVKWNKSGLEYKAHDRWVDFWDAVRL